MKFLLGLEDQRNVEMVLIPEKARITLCVSTQVGCRQACGFCHTGRMGLIRNLDAAEIVAQVTLANHFIAENPSWSKHSTSRRRVTNVVYMGMGEPMDNLSAVMKSIDILTDSRGLAIGLAKISVSTAGHIDGMREISVKYPRLPLAVSLHSPFDEQRTKLMPINKRYPLSNLVLLLESISVNHPVMIQYTLIKGVNDSLDHAHALVSLLRNCAVKINIIPLNEIEPTRFTGPSPESLTKFRNVLYDAGLRTMIRYSKGQDIYGACGQLIPLEKT